MSSYFDYAATCPIDEEALEAYVKASREFYGNTRSLHDSGTKAEVLLSHCRKTLANLLGVNKEGIYFTSGGTESNLLAMEGLMKAGKGNHLITSAAEHSSVKNSAEKLEADGYEVSWVPLTKDGTIDVSELENLMREDTVLVCIQHVNSDIGTIQPIGRIREVCDKWGAWLHSDCVQSFGKVELNSIIPCLDSFSLSSHKIYGPKGSGALYISPSVSFQPLLPNGTHEAGVRAGTVNTPGIAAFTTAAAKSIRELQERQTKIKALKREFLTALKDIRSQVKVVGESGNSVPIIGLCIHGFEGQWVMLEANRRGYAFSTGSACQVGSEGFPSILTAVGLNKEEAKSFIRLSFSHDQTSEDIQGIVECLKEIAAEYAVLSSQVEKPAFYK
ncbi:cysteine desulfurase [Halobacillus alkaliphilus]|uniref:Cysteine desulfurase n=1 Tax=Halobacillus alkaliphilus TaxID=396056 RepID=A0A1I2PRX5_9BACI|nr:IscS subfamily cysteine desulfurase [Halobacillus alkaliphilus]SFG18818.1 cysteine desulfurase [Halobacillus alkaliphilus]